MNNSLNLVYDDWPEKSNYPNANRPISPAFWEACNSDINSKKTKYEIFENKFDNKIIIRLPYDIKLYGDSYINITSLINEIKPKSNDKSVFIEFNKNKVDLITEDNNNLICNFEVSYEVMKEFKNVEIVNYKIDDIIKHPDKQFFYHVWPRSDLFLPFLKYNILPLNANVINLLKNNKNLNLIFMNHVEACFKQTFKKLNELLLNNEIDTSKVWVITNNQKIQKYKEELNSKINVYACKIFTNCFNLNTIISFKPNKDGSFFLCHNRMPRIHRYGILCLLKKYNILDDVDWSLINGWEKNKIQNIKDYCNIFTDTDINNLSAEMHYFNEIDTFKSKYELNYTNFDDRLNPSDFDDFNTHENSYINIVTETNFLDDVIHITEKSFRPFWFLQFPIMIASHEHIRYMKNIYDFDWFDDIIDHSYDDIKDNRNRLMAVADEIKRIYENKEFFIEFYKNNEDRFIANRNKLKNYNHTIGDDFFEKIMEDIKC